MNINNTPPKGVKTLFIALILFGLSSKPLQVTQLPDNDEIEPRQQLLVERVEPTREEGFTLPSFGEGFEDRSRSRTREIDRSRTESLEMDFVEEEPAIDREAVSLMDADKRHYIEMRREGREVDRETAKRIYKSRV